VRWFDCSADDVEQICSHRVEVDGLSQLRGECG